MYLKECSKCKTEKSYLLFYKDSRSKDKLKSICKNCHNKTSHRNRNKRIMDRNNIINYIESSYKHMSCRVRGKEKSSANGKEILTYKDFKKWSLENDNLRMLIKEYILNKLDNRLVPTIDRINIKYGYIKDNIRWITKKDNSAKGASLDKKLLNKNIYKVA